MNVVTIGSVESFFSVVFFKELSSNQVSLISCVISNCDQRHLDGILNDFRIDFNPRIAVTVDMIATGTDVKPLEILLFMRDVRSKGYYEQMKGRGVRSLSYEDLHNVSKSATRHWAYWQPVEACYSGGSPTPSPFPKSQD